MTDIAKGEVVEEKTEVTNDFIRDPLPNIEINSENNFSQESIRLVLEFMCFNDCEKKLIWRTLHPRSNKEIFRLPSKSPDKQKIVCFLNKIFGSTNLIVQDNRIKMNITENTTETTEFLKMNDDEKLFIRNVLLNFGKISIFSFVGYPNANKQTVRNFLGKVLGIAVVIVSCILVVEK
jgi:hypothetical protein